MGFVLLCMMTVGPAWRIRTGAMSSDAMADVAAMTAAVAAMIFIVASLPLPVSAQARRFAGFAGALRGWLDRGGCALPRLRGIAFNGVGFIRKAARRVF